MNKPQRGFTLVELLVVLIVIGILAALAIPNFAKTKERALDREAQTALRLIQAADKIYNVKYNFYWPNATSGSWTLSDINATLRLDLLGNNWNYTISGNSATAGSDFTATASRTVGGSTRSWTVNKASDPACISNCL